MLHYPQLIPTAAEMWQKDENDGHSGMTGLAAGSTFAFVSISCRRTICHPENGGILMD